MTNSEQLLNEVSPQQAALELERRVGLRDLYYFNNVILGYHEMAQEPHGLMCSAVLQGSKKQLHLWPRGHFKSTMITIGNVIRRVSENPNIRILIANSTSTKSEAFLREIKGHIEKNEKYREIYGNHFNKEKWTDKEIISAQRTKNLKEPTILAVGVGQSVTGFHFDLIVGDDLVDYDSVNTPEQIAKTKRWWGDAMSLLEPDGDVILIGTRYHYADLYGDIIENLKEEYRPQVHSVYKEDGSILFPSRFSQEKLDAIRKEQGSYMFSCQYLNDPVDDETAKFKKSWFKYEPVEALEGKQFWTTMTVDRAYSLNKSADYTAFTIRKVDRDNFWHIQKPIRIRATEGEIVNKIFDLKNHYKVDRIGIEQLAFNNTLKPVLDEEMRRRNDYFEVVELTGRASKIARIEGLVPRFESGSIYFTGNQEDFIELEDELVRFPVASHDDLADSLAYHNDEEMYGMPSGEIDLPEYQPTFSRTGY